jgi:hypothetical protein
VRAAFSISIERAADWVAIMSFRESAVSLSRSSESIVKFPNAATPNLAGREDLWLDYSAIRIFR